MKELSVAILNFNGRRHLETYLPSVVEYSDPYEVIVIDNGSTDQSIDYVQKNFPSIKLISFEENHGFCGGYNRAMKLIDTEYVVLLNTDVRVSKNWITPVLNYLQSNPDIKAAQPKIRDDKNPDYFEYAGAAGGYLDSLAYPLCRGRIFETIEKDNGQFNKNELVSWASGSCLFIKRDIFNELGGLDERYFAHMEEIDLSWRIWNHGYKVGYCAESTVFHLGGGTLSKSHSKKTYLNFRNGLSLLLKNEKAINLIWKLPLRIALDWLAILKFTVQSGFKHGFAIIRAHIDFMKEFRNTVRLRRPHVKNKRPSFKGLIVWRYFVLGKRKFSQLPIEHLN